MGGAGAVSGANAAAQPQTRIVRADLASVDDAQDSSLRPKSLSEFLGQSAIKENLGVFIDAARKRQEALDHL
ncbi:MAG: Holliday junction branch migration DNA helicase RuvB, partial [Treponema sp.]|nr:Holliday junction branch migration DNA helicase RuvB [Treponema sp.]